VYARHEDPTDLPWEEFAVVPESYATTWSRLYGSLQIEKGQTILFRGATPALGQAALNIAASTGLNLIATPRNQARFEKLLGLGPKRAELEGPRLSKRLPEARKAGVPLDFVGNRTLFDSITIPDRHGRICLAGRLDSNPGVKWPIQSAMQTARGAKRAPWLDSYR
jgi:NADPH:quinone reductase-like Zn-dependent oxidoreductase